MVIEIPEWLMAAIFYLVFIPLILLAVFWVWLNLIRFFRTFLENRNLYLLTLAAIYARDWRKSTKRILMHDFEALKIKLQNGDPEIFEEIKSILNKG